MDKVDLEYEKDEKLSKADVAKIQNWLESQLHLPKMTDQEVIWFLKSNNYNYEIAKENIDTFFTLRTLSPEILRDRNMKSIEVSVEAVVFAVLPEKTPEGYTILMSHLMDKTPENFLMLEVLKMFDMVVMLDLYKNGTPDGLVICFDMEGISFAHIAGLPIVSLKKFIYYLQDALPVKIKGIHFFNITSVMDTLLKLLKPYMKQKLFDVLHLHTSIDGLAEFIPPEVFPKDIGGKSEPTHVFHEQMKKNLEENASFFSYQDSQVVDETKRLEKPTYYTEIFGIDGTFKKLELD